MESTTDYLENERVKLWAHALETRKVIDELGELIHKKTPEYEADARQASRKASEFRNKCETTKNDAVNILNEIQDLHRSSQKSAELLRTLASQVPTTDTLIQEIKSIHIEVATAKSSINEHIEKLEETFENHDSYLEKIDSLEGIFDQADDLSRKIKASYDQLMSRKKEIDELYYGIIGYKNIDSETNEETEVQGLKHELENQYSELKVGFAKFSEETKKEVNKNLAAWEDEYSTVVDKVNSLLPHALTAGLSHAYSQKKLDEIKEGTALDTVFKRYVMGLVAISLIPFGVSIFQLFQGATLEHVITQMPRLVLSIFPLYVPVLWVAYSANKKINLSKRLVEEYTHKEVLSKTFEGLAQQIENIRDPEISADLKTRLLYNILEVSSENPGKLISDYDKSDHPLMDALDKSVKLSNAVDKVSKIPGFSKLASVLASKSDAIVKVEDKKATSGLSIAEKSEHAGA